MSDLSPQQIAEKRALDFAGNLHDAIHEAAALVDMEGHMIGWAPEDSIPMITRGLIEFQEGQLAEFSSRLIEAEMKNGEFHNKLALASYPGHYISTYCQHGDHAACFATTKQEEPCVCACGHPDGSSKRPTYQELQIGIAEQALTLRRVREEVRAICLDLDRCAKQNDADARPSSWIPHSLDGAQARAVAGEQRRMIVIIQKLLALLQPGAGREPA